MNLLISIEFFFFGVIGIKFVFVSGFECVCACEVNELYLRESVNSVCEI